jgi:hypothetical protein
MRRMAIALGVAAVVLAAGVYAQGKNFSGKWTIDAEKTAAAAPAGAAAGGGGGGGNRGGGGGGNMPAGAGDITITMDAKTMKVESGMQGATPAVYNLDGSDSKNMMPGRGGAEPTEQVSKAKWDGDKLVITYTGANGENKTSYWLEGGNLVRETLNAGRGGAAGTPRKTIFKKAS